MYSGSEKYYDDLYASMGKDYAAETDKIHKFIETHKVSDGNLLLDVACGTGMHAGYLCRYYKIEGIDLNGNMLKIARKNNPKIPFIQGDMRSFDIHRQFDVITCLFSAIGYMTKKSDLYKAIKNMSRHLLPGGVLLVEPWFTPEQWHPGRVGTLQVDKPDQKIVRMSHSGRKGKISLVNFQYLIGTARGIENFTELLELGLFTHDEYLRAFTKAGLITTHDPEGIFDRGLYMGVKPSK